MNSQMGLLVVKAHVEDLMREADRARLARASLSASPGRRMAAFRSRSRQRMARTGLLRGCLEPRPCVDDW